MEKQRITTRRIAVAALIGAVYAALTIALAPISYGPVQFRVSEVLCILPYFVPYSAWGLYAGCILANLFTGNIFDILFGSLATLFAGLLTARIGRREHTLANSALACFMPVIFNAVIVGAVLTWGYGIQEIEGSAPLSFIYSPISPSSSSVPLCGMISSLKSIQAISSEAGFHSGRPSPFGSPHFMKFAQ